MTRRFYITTPIYYPNGEPHLGHVYTTVCADVIARYHRLAGGRTWFLTGTDWHGIKMVKSAEEQKTTPQALAEKNDQTFIDFWKELGITNDDYIRTSEPRHVKSVTEIVNRMLASGDIYLGSYEGWYDEGQEEFITETEAKANEFKSVVSGKPLGRYKESTYFFKLTKYVDRVFQAIESDQIRVLPPSRKNEILSKLKGWNQDLSISRASLKWGIVMPNDPEHVLYVWIDALSNYITALGLPGSTDDKDGNEAGEKDGKEADKDLAAFWPADVHLIGKEILWFHAFYWPAMLMSLDLPLPKTLFAHGWWTSEGKKMGKSLGNFIDMDRLRAVNLTYSLDTLRYYLLRAAPFGSDLDWKETELATAYAELGNVVGNLLNRTMNMITKYRDAKVPALGITEDRDAVLIKTLADLPAAVAGAFAGLELQRAVLLPIEAARAVNTYIDQTQPFKLAKDPAQQKQLDTVLNLCAQGCKKVLAALLPILPAKAAAGLAQMNVVLDGQTIADLIGSDLPAGHQLGTAAVLFPRIETK
ncbi:MAG: methionine--tRNA ligase [Burkholderiales bacterium]|nr:methionine--tRNA ligase [Phycisphaerae bacterium]